MINLTNTLLDTCFKCDENSVDYLNYDKTFISLLTLFVLRFI